MTYQEQLQSPLWQKKRLEIMQRDGWKCRRCHRNDRQLHVHHANGYKNGKPPWDYPDAELVTLCADCHENHHHPKALNIYLAGKIGHTDWRHSIVNGIRGFDWDIEYNAPNKEWEFWRYKLERAIFGTHHYVGPFFLSCDHGCCHGKNSHGCKGYGDHHDGLQCCRDNVNTGHAMVLKNSTIAIENCDLLFAWINSADCYGTIAEIGYANALRKSIFVAADKPYPDLWFAVEMSFAPLMICKHPKKALEKSIELLAV